MQKLLKNKRLLAIVLCAVLVVTISGVGAFAALAGDLISGGSSSSEIEESFSSSTESSSQSASASESQSQSEPEQEPVKFNKPDEMRAVYLQAGEDFLNGKDSSAEQIKSNIDKAIANALALDMNTLIIPLTYGGGAIFQSAQLPAATRELDILQYLVEKARASALYVYGVYDLTPEILTDSTPMTKVDGESLDELYATLKELAASYAVDGILLDGYYYPGEDSYSAYKADGAGMGYDNYLYQSTYKLVKTAADAIAAGSAGIQIGLAADAVWANKADNEAGSDTSASFQALYDGHADTRQMIEDQLFDFVAVKAFGATGSSSAPFETVVNWWASLVQSQELPLYVIHATDKVCTTEEGWSAPEELAKQYDAAKKIAGCQGSAFTSLGTLLSNPKDATEYLTQMFTGEVKTEHILTELVLTKPAKTTYTTSEVNVTFVGASALDYELTVNGEDVPRDDNGAFTLVKELKAGLNTFTFEHKDKTITYNITRQVNVIDANSVTPVGSVALEGGMKLSISAMAYDGAAVTATVGGQTVTLQQTKVEDENTDRESAYKKFIGEITVPAATSSVQNLGNITVTATWQGITGKATGAAVSVNKKVNQTQVVPGVDTGTGQLIEVTATSAETFPTNVLDDISDSDCYPLAKGTRDYLASDLLTYKDGNTTYTYYILQSGQRVYAKDIKMVSGDINNNVIDNLTVTSDGTYTKVILSTKQPVAYKAYYSSGGFSLAFSYTTEVPTSLSLRKNPLFSAANWNGSTLQLKFRTADGFLGYKAYYENGNLVFRFNSPPAVGGGSLSGVRVSIDPGHCSTCLLYTSGVNQRRCRHGPAFT